MQQCIYQCHIFIIGKLHAYLRCKRNRHTDTTAFLWVANGCSCWLPSTPRLLFTGWLSTELTTELSHSPTSYFMSLHSTELVKTLTAAQLVSTSYNLGLDPTENIFLLLLHVLPSNGHCLQSHCLATGLYTTIHMLVKLFSSLPVLL
jgi:hypothetical protein